jgi:hypothetical protein
MTPCDVKPWKHLLARGTSLTDSGSKRGASFKPGRGEKAYLFDSDSQRFREHFHNQKSCDGIFLIETATERRLVFIELKGRNLEDAAAQLLETLQAVRKQLPADCRKSTKLEVVVVRGGAPPRQEVSKMLEQFEQKTGLVLRCRSIPPGKSWDLR